MLYWQDMEEFQHVDLIDSCVLSWRQHDGSLVFEIEARLWPGHPRYAEPPKTHWTCYRNATLTRIERYIQPLAERTYLLTLPTADELLSDEVITVMEAMSAQYAERLGVDLASVTRGHKGLVSKLAGQHASTDRQQSA